MARPALSADELLTTTRAVRKRLDLDREVPHELLVECVEIARQAPTGSNSQGWHFVLVDDPKLREELAALYLKGWNKYLQSPGSLGDIVDDPHATADLPTPDHFDAQMKRVLSSAQYLAENLARVPVHMIPCVKGRTDKMQGTYANAVHSAIYGSIIPATWNYMLAARSRGLGTAWTTAHLIFERDAADLLGIPYADFTQVALIPTAYYLGDSFKPAIRKPIADVLHHNGW